MGVKTLLDASLKYNVKRFHQVSTDEVYGELPLNDLDLHFTENSPLNPTSPYSKSKAMADMLVLNYFHADNLDVAISRSTNNYGIYQHPEKLIPKTVKMALNKENITVYGDGLNVRDWLYVYDHCEAIDVVLHKGKVGEVYNIGGHNEKTNMEITRLILEAMGKDESSIRYVEDRLGHDRRYAISNDKITSELGWAPSITFEEGIKLTIDWYLNNQDWMKSIEAKKASLV
jgi:dTDP-glucose 4,6-dehydratase